MTFDHQNTELLIRYLDGALDPQQCEEMEACLRESPSSRRRLRELAEHAVVVANSAGDDTARSRENVELVESGSNRTFSTNWMIWVAGVTASVLVAVGIFEWPRNATNDRLIQIVSVNGYAAWIGNDGTENENLSAGDWLPQGTLKTDGELASLELRFADSTTIALAGESDMSFSEKGGKLVEVRQGAFSADVAKQPAGSPMRVRTPTADLEVVGTSFVLNTSHDVTSLGVTEGLVRMRRLVDGHEVEVAASEVVNASLDRQEGMKPMAMVAPPQEWLSEFSKFPNQITGKWLPTDENGPGRIASAPIFHRRRSDGQLRVLQGVKLAANQPDASGAFASLADDSKLRIRYRVTERCRVQLMFSSAFPGGNFAGNYEFNIEPEDVVAGPWQTAEIEFVRFEDKHPHLGRDFSKRVLTAFIITTHDQIAGLEIAELGVVKAK